MKHFLSCVEKGEPSLIPLSEGVESLRMALAARDSIATGRVTSMTGGEGA
jgi:predicted dehydrogenase